MRSWVLLVSLFLGAHLRLAGDGETVALSADKTTVPVGGTVTLRMEVLGLTDVLATNPEYQEKNVFPQTLLVGSVFMMAAEPDVTVISGGPARVGGPVWDYPYLQPRVVREITVRLNKEGAYSFTGSLWLAKRRGDFPNNWDGIEDKRLIGGRLETEYSWVGSATPVSTPVVVTATNALAASIEIVPKGGHEFLEGNKGARTFIDGADYDVRWTTTGATSASVTRDGAAISSALNGGRRFDDPRPVTSSTVVNYTISATNGTRTETSSVTVTILRRDLELRPFYSNPGAALSPAEQTVTLGKSATLTPTIPDPSQVASSVLTGEGITVTNPSGPVSVTPSSYGDKEYTFTSTGRANLRWLGDLASFARLELNRPDGTIEDVTGRFGTVATMSGPYSLTATDSVGNRVTSESVDVVIPTASASATVRVRLPRTIGFADQTMVFRDTLALAATTNGDGAPSYALVSGPGQVSGDRFEATGSGLARVRVSYPETAVYMAGEAEATIRIRPRIVSFTAEDPPAPTVSLNPALAPPIVLGESVTWSLRATNAAEVRVSGSGIDQLNPPEVLMVTPTATGIQVYEARATARPYGTLRWQVEGAARVEVGGSTRVGSEWTEAPAGSHRLHAIGGDDVDAWSDEQSIRIPPPAQARASVPVRPRITAFTVSPPPAPTASLQLSPASGWVNPARVEANWTTEHASRVVLTGTGRAFSWNRTDLTGTAPLVLEPGPKQFELRAEPGPGLARWELAGALSAELMLPDGTRASIAADTGTRELYLPGGYKVVAHGPDSLDTESSPEALVFPAAALASASGTVAVTLTVEGGIGGRGLGSRVVPFGEVASFNAEPERGYHWTAWTGDTLAQRNPASETMEQDRRVVAEFAPNRYLINAEAQPARAGRVEGGGSHLFGTDALLTAYPEKYYRFTSWLGSAAVGPALSVPVREDASFTALFERIQYRLTVRTEGAGTGAVSPGGGLRPAGIGVILTAQPDARSRFMGWSGDASGSAPAVTVDMEADREVVVRFEPKLTQVISLDRPLDQEPGHGVAVAPSANSGLPVTLVVVSGPAEVRGGTVWVTGVGTIVLRATQEGNDVYLPADPAEVAFAGVKAPAVALQEAGASVTLQNSQTREPNWQVKGE
ncbi:InlB B-repeat-containing protein [Nibricoccus sp. IMCC34717]|uniref:InlB B-repeat-containing protein n=1 Tax=Nibricoccus sp. IMCC34717 TaxID=3034021 RepID=UPI00384E3CE0